MLGLGMDLERKLIRYDFSMLHNHLPNGMDKKLGDWRERGAIRAPAGRY